MLPIFGKRSASLSQASVVKLCFCSSVRPANSATVRCRNDVMHIGDTCDPYKWSRGSGSVVGGSSGNVSRLLLGAMLAGMSEVSVDGSRGDGILCVDGIALDTRGEAVL